MPFLKFCPKPKRALRISSPYLAEPVQKAYQRVFAFMELLKIVLTFYPRESNNYPANSQCLPAKKHFRYNYLQVASKVLNKHVSVQHFRYRYLELSVPANPSKIMQLSFASFDTHFLFVVSLSLIKAKIIVPSMYSFGQM